MIMIHDKVMLLHDFGHMFSPAISQHWKMKRCFSNPTARFIFPILHVSMEERFRQGPDRRYLKDGIWGINAMDLISRNTERFKNFLRELSARTLCLAFLPDFKSDLDGKNEKVQKMQGSVSFICWF
jgi:hypothetical protein